MNEQTKPKLVAPRFPLKWDSKDWARNVLNDPKRYPSIAVKFAKEALGVN